MSNNRIPFASVFCTFFVPVLLAFATAPSFAQDTDGARATDGLSKALVRKLEQKIIPALTSGNDMQFLDAVSPVIANGDAELFEAIENYCNQNSLPSIQKKYVNIQLQLIEQGLITADSKIKLPVATLIATELSQRVAEQVARAEELELMQDPLVSPPDWREGEQFFWEIHVAKNELDNAARMLEYCVAVLSPHFKKVARSSDAQAQAVFEHVERLVTEFTSLRRNMIEREAEARLSRLGIAHRTLIGDADFENSLFAAMALEIDGPLLVDFFQINKSETLSRHSIKDTETILSEVKTKLESARKAEPDTIAKSGLLLNGLHYWLRGRYGIGSEADGLLKSQDAMKSDSAMEALYMPRERPKLISQFLAEEQRTPGYDRRHYYTWAVEQHALLVHQGGTILTGGQQESFFL